VRRTDAPTRRALLGTLSTLGAAGLAGCDALPEGADGTGRTADDGAGDGDDAAPTGGRTAEATSDAAFEQTVTVRNPNATAAYVTVAAESRSGATAFVRSVELTPGERRSVRAELPGPGAYRLVAEASDGGRAAFDWVADERLDGCAVTLRDGTFGFWRTAVCRGDCDLATSGGGGAIPLVGDGEGRWYAPASVVLENPDPSVRRARVAVELDGETVLTATYDVPARTQVELPVTYRSGEYRVRVATDGATVADSWTVPDQPSLFVDLRDRETGCGVANSELTLVNYDDVEHTVTVQVASDERGLFADRWTLAPEERASVVPVPSAGRYEVRVQIDGVDQFSSVWWSCPPRGPATLVVDATGGGSLSQTPPMRE
jgi:uncharacterized cupredoxin-like copper-binding protein